jgi:hypothetical protein
MPVEGGGDEQPTLPDATSGDGALPGNGGPDAAAPEAGPREAGSVDAGAVDAIAPVDASTADTSSPDSAMTTILSGGDGGVGTTLAQSVSSFVLGDSVIYYTTTTPGGIMSLPTAGGSPSVVYATSDPVEELVYVPSSHLVYLDTMQSSLDDLTVGSPLPNPVYSYLIFLPEQIATNTQTAYWFGFPGSNNSESASEETLVFCSLGGCPAGPTAVVSGSEVWSSGSVATGGGNVYWVAGDGALRFCPATGCAAATVLAPPTAGTVKPAGIAVGSSSVDFAIAPGGLFSCATTGCAQGPTTITTAAVAAFAADDTNVYYSDGILTDPLVASCPQAGCTGAPRTVVPNGSGDVLVQLAVDETYVYALTTAGTLLRAPK